MKFRYFLASLAGLWCLGQAALLAAPAHALPVPPFEARYTGYAAFGDLSIPGELVMKLAYEGNDGYRMSSEIRPSGPASLLISLSEQVSGRLQGDAVRPLSYEQRLRGVKNSRTELNFDWQEGTLQARHDNERATLSLASEAVDPLSLHLVVMSDLQRNQARDQYTLVDDTELKTYRVERDGEETLQTPLGALQTIRVSQNRPGSSRTTTFWFAPALGYLAVQIVQEKNGKETLRMSIEEVKGISVKQ